MSGRVVFFVQRAGFEPAWQALSAALTARAMGDEVVLVFASDALRALANGRFGEPQPGEDAEASRRGVDIGAATPVSMVDDAKALGVRRLACDTTARLCGVDAEALVARGVLDAVQGLPSIWKLTDGARVLTY